MNDQPGKRKILLVMPDYMDYTDLMYKGIRDFLGTEVSLVTTTGIESRFSYKSNSHRVQNFFLKNFFNRDDKKLHYLEIIRQKLQTVFDANPRFDDILILRPDLIEVHLAWIKEHTTCMIAYFWDSFSREPGGKKTIQYFDRYFSFEPRDVKKYDLHFLPNFFPNDLSPVKGENPVDLFFIASYDSRIGTLKRILRSLKTQGLHTNINIFSQDIPSKNPSPPPINGRQEFITRCDVIHILQ